MQKINLLPRDLAPAGLSEELVSAIRKIAVALGGLLLILVLAAGASHLEMSRKNKILAGMMTKVKETDLLAENIEDLRRRKGELKQELENVNSYLERGLIWSKKLMQISFIMPEEVWLSRMSFKRQDIEAGKRQALNMSGGLVPLEDAPAINVLSAFINKLKEDKEFFADFDDLLIREVRTAKKGNIDIMEFELQLVLK